MITEQEYKERFIKQLEKNHKNFFETVAQALWEAYSDSANGLEDNTPEDMADEERGYW